MNGIIPAHRVEGETLFDLEPRQRLRIALTAVS
jgi:hypothetical protein